MSHQAFADVPTAIEEIRAGRMIVVVDDEDRENEVPLAAMPLRTNRIRSVARLAVPD